MKPKSVPRCPCGAALDRHDISNDARGRRICYVCARQQPAEHIQMLPVPIDKSGERIRFPGNMDPSEYPAYLATLKGRKAPVGQPAAKTKRRVPA